MGNRRRKSKRPPRHARRAIGGEVQAQRITGQRADRLIVDDPYSGIDRSVADRSAIAEWFTRHEGPPVWFTTEPADGSPISFRALAAVMAQAPDPRPIMMSQQLYDRLYMELGAREHERMRRETRSPQQAADDDRVDAIAYAYRHVASRSEVASAIARFDASNTKKSTSGYPQLAKMPRRR